MKITIAILFLLLFASFSSAAYAAGNSCYRKAQSYQSLPGGTQEMTLDARRVVSFTRRTIIYDLGKKTITIAADSLVAQYFLRDLAAGRCTARANVTLEPESNNPLNTRYKAVRTSSH
ncbi:MAG TPA: hypothetical protein PLM47_09155 [Smithellaceae bacterium]|nr:hypothetical protein [Smithellaceae bacterium]